MKKLEAIATAADFHATDAPGACARANSQYYDRFFGDLVVGDVFAYSESFISDDVKKMAEDRGYKIKFLNCSETKGEYACRIIATPKQKELPTPESTIVYGLYTFFEGRGDTLTGTFINEDDAWAIVAGLTGTQDRSPDGDISVKPLTLYPSTETYHREKENNERAAALAKLSPREKMLLGIKD